jgi:hypothetical protein
LLALLVAACDRNYSSPTAPTPPRLTPEPDAPSGLWSGTWTLDLVAPAGDCLADYLNGYTFQYSIDLEVEIAGDRIDLTFLYPFRANAGFWPLHYSGTVNSGGAVSALVPAERLGSLRQDPWLELCYWEWSTQGGQLSATLSPDRHSIAGTVVETYRVEDANRDASFTIESSFSARMR